MALIVVADIETDVTNILALRFRAERRIAAAPYIQQLSVAEDGLQKCDPAPRTDEHLHPGRQVGVSGLCCHAMNARGNPVQAGEGDSMEFASGA